MSKPPSEPIILANWGRRFLAWLIEFLFVNVMLAYFNPEGLESRFLPSFLFPSLWSPVSILVLYVYWTLSEWYFGRSIGQLLLNLRLTDLNGRGVSLPASAIQSIGKAIDFPLLPLDCFIGWTYPPCKKARQRFFNKLSNTIVIYLGKPMHTIKEDGYEKEA